MSIVARLPKRSDEFTDDWATIRKELQTDLDDLQKKVEVELSTTTLSLVQPDPNIWCVTNMDNVVDLTEDAVFDYWNGQEDQGNQEQTEKPEDVHHRITARFEIPIELLEASRKPVHRKQRKQRSVLDVLSPGKRSSLNLLATVLFVELLIFMGLLVTVA